MGGVFVYGVPYSELYVRTKAPYEIEMFFRKEGRSSFVYDEENDLFPLRGRPLCLLPDSCETDPTFYPNRPQQRPTQTDILQEAVADISRPNETLSNTDRPPGTLRSLDG